jgi:hypothetical protein
MKNTLKILVAVYSMVSMVGCAFHTTRSYSYTYGNAPETPTRVIYSPVVKVTPNYMYPDTESYYVPKNRRYNVSFPPPSYVCY